MAASIALGGIPNKVQVGDMGEDGRILPVSSSAAPRKQQEGELGLKERWYPIQVKQKDKAVIANSLLNYHFFAPRFHAANSSE
jgi:hypothetical protein